MNGQEKKYRRILEEYLDSIDNENENCELIMELEDAREIFAEARNCFEEARLAQFLYYKHIASKRKSAVIDSLVSVFKEKQQLNTKYENIWDYLNCTIMSNNLSWEQILREVKMNPRFASSFKNGEMNLSRVAPEKLAEISRILKVDSNQVLQLAYQWFLKAKNELKHTPAISYREVSCGFDTCNDDISKNEENDEDRKMVIRYIQELEEALR